MAELFYQANDLTHNVLIAPILFMEILYQELQIVLEPGDLVLALAPVAIVLVLCRWQDLQLEWGILQAGGRAILQLLILGLGLDLGFSFNHPLGTGVLVLVLVGMAMVVVRNRLGIPLSWLWLGASLGLTTGAIVSYAIFVIIRPQPWYAPPYWLVLSGLILANGINVATGTGESLLQQIKTQRLSLETHLSLGATPAQATATARRAALRNGVVPTLNLVAITGLATLPPFVAGQVLSGLDPLVAVSYQLLLLLLLLTSAVTIALVLTWGVIHHCFNAAGQLRI